ncbi:Reverse transcriptase RNA-dependent DNA polymerase [Arabidopsis thaliana x Arabidopsis arenosa]|uniref:Reverse transcriptase RNA-dependent DNA polymerase n=1 Tax=Arabidopsis thaliana x Arabidopsis arenosa TaxID=1240361 RepID=A0A8T1ZK60_9BRAS|nr:Reverse transcriptase RNA-dependent DNA polymerase [Arabidopsis thaliana x Arabidopsis arenosa]
MIPTFHPSWAGAYWAVLFVPWTGPTIHFILLIHYLSGPDPNCGIRHQQDGSINKHKARLVAKGYVQRHGVDYDEVFAPVARIETIRFIIALAASNGWEVHHLDVKTAFLHGELKEDVYVLQPEGFVKEGSEEKVYKLNKALYGPKQASRAWNNKLNKILLDLKFIKCSKEPSFYRKTENDESLVVAVYVDNLLVTGSSLQLILEFKKGMSAQFEMSDLGKLTYYIGIEVIQYERGIMLKQESDSSHNIDEDDGKSTTGHIFYLNDCPITWCSQKQNIVALSSCEAEFMAATEAAKQAVWLQELLGEVIGGLSKRVLILLDNKSAIALTKNPVFHGRSKHIHKRYHFIRECIENELVEVDHVPGEIQKADILTKALARIRFKEMRGIVGVQDIAKIQLQA